jgi:hypothetical protein
MNKWFSFSSDRVFLSLLMLFALLALLAGCGLDQTENSDSKDFNITSKAESAVALQIVIDGNASDWASIQPIVTETRQSALSLSVTHDDTYLYFCIKGKRMGPYYGLYLNTDLNGSTGYQGSPWGSTGFDYYIENGNLFVSLGPGWSWQYLGGVSSASNASVVEIAVARTALAGLANEIALASIDIGSAWGIKSLLPAQAPLPHYTLVPAATSPVGILVPAYFYPGYYWDTLAARAALAPGRITAIANPGSGPGAIPDPNYTNAINNLRNAGGRVIGYVYTVYGTRNITDVKTDIDTWYQFYPIDGIFLDQQPNVTGYEPYYHELYQYIKSKQSTSLVVGNPGAGTSETYLFYQGNRIADVLCIFETAAGFPVWEPPVWCANYSKENFSVLPFGTLSGSYASYVDRAASRNMGWIYCTEDNFPNPWDTLPSYFAEFCDYVTTSY